MNHYINKPNKVRIVFDAAAKYKQSCLNEQLFKGPDLLNNLVGIIMRFRQGIIGVIGDIEQMFHQVKVMEKDRDSIRFVWRDNPNKPIKDYIMTVHLFGKVDSSCCCNWALRQTAENYQGSYDQEIAETITRYFYMDDYLNSFPSKEKAIEITLRVIEKLKTGGFNLIKFLSNDRNVLKSLPNNSHSPKLLDLDLDNMPIERALGVLWDPNYDVLKVKCVNKDVPFTKRGILSFTSSIFDPLGILAPAILFPKLLIQELWRKKIDWDDVIPNELLIRWTKWRSNLSKLSSIYIPRWYYTMQIHNQTVELHIFADASEIAYGAVAYIKAINKGEINCSFVQAKSRLAPIKKRSLTIPKLELQATLIASRMKKVIEHELDINFTKIYLWSDSTTALKYIKHNLHHSMAS